MSTQATKQKEQQTMTSIDTASAFAGATNERSPSAKFDELGKTYKGRVARIGEFTGPNAFNGNEETSVTIDLECDDGETYTLWARTHINGDVVPNGITRAVADAVRAAGKNGLPEVGGQLAIRYDSDGQSSKAGMSPPKIYRAQYQPPTSVPATQAGGPFDAPDAAPVQEVPVAQAAPAPAGPASDDLF